MGLYICYTHDAMVATTRRQEIIHLSQGLRLNKIDNCAVAHGDNGMSKSEAYILGEVRALCVCLWDGGFSDVAL